MQQRNVARELGLAVAFVAVLDHWLDPGPAFLVAVLVAVAAALGTGPIVGEWRPWRLPAIPMMLPALAAFSIAGIARLVAPWPWLPLVFLVGWFMVAWSVRLETAPDVLAHAESVAGAGGGVASEPEAASAPAPAVCSAASSAEPVPAVWSAASSAPAPAVWSAASSAEPMPAVSAEEPEDGKSQTRAALTTPRISAVAAAVDLTPPTIRVRPRPRAEFGLAQIVTETVVPGTPQMPPHPRPLAVRAAGLSIAFFGFVAAGGLVPGGLAIDRTALATNELIRFVLLNAVVAGVVGYRLAALASPHRMDRIVRIVAVGQYAVPVAAGAFILRSLALPVLFIPALLGVITYLLTELRESPDPVTQNQRLLEELAVIGVAVVAVVLWGLFGR
jgi:hypothetical protein